MSQKQFDHIENKIRQAAESFEPDFEEGSWDKMEALLNKEEKDRRRPFGWLWFALALLLITGAGTFLLFNHQPKKAEQNITKYTQQNKQKSVEQPLSVTPNKTIIISKAEDLSIPNNITPTNQQLTIIDPVLNKRILAKSKTTAQVYTPDISEALEPLTQTKNANSEIMIVEGKTDENLIDNIIDPSEETIVISRTNAKKNVLAIAVKDTATIAIDTTATISTAKKEVKKESTTKPSRFYFIAFAGIDESNVKLLSFTNSKSQLKYGIGVGYQLNNKISVQSGFYAGHKKYTAGPADYKIKAGSYMSTVDMNKVDADCMIYEIPLLLRYNWLQKNKTILFATTGLSSFIMKNEDYNYYYQYNNAPYQTEKEYTGNQHLFSVLNFSIGVERKISSRFSILAEPCIAIPLAGVGEGSVKLYSAGLQVGLKYQPLKK